MGTLDNATTRSQKAAIREYLLKYGRINKKEALALCECDRLTSRIYDLKNDPLDPMDIETVYETKKNCFGHTTRYAVYRLVRKDGV